MLAGRHVPRKPVKVVFVTQTWRAGSPTSGDPNAPTSADEAIDARDQSRTGVSGAISRAVRRSARSASLPTDGDRLRADRARAILERDGSRREVQALRLELARIHERLARVLTGIEHGHAAREEVVGALRRIHERQDLLTTALVEQPQEHRSPTIIDLADG